MSRFRRAVVVLTGLVLLGCGPGADEPRLRPSGRAITAPDAQQSFSRYIEIGRQRIEQALRPRFEREATPFGEHYTLEQVVDMRAAWQMAPRPVCGSGRGPGFLFLHGLTDSPYTLKPLARELARTHPCAIMRGVLLPGHGTVPGDMLSMQREDWKGTVEYAVDQFRGETDTLYLVGYSAGATLAVDYADRHRDEELVSGLVLLSPAMGLSNPVAWLTPVLRWIRPWMNVSGDRDAAKYESFALNAAAQMYRLLRDLAPQRMQPLDIPVFMALSGDDTTVDAGASRRFFCDKAPSSRRHMIWYHAQVTDSRPRESCEGMQLQAAAAPRMRFVSYSHVSITLPPDDPHYGMDGHYAHCLGYQGRPSEYRRCRQADRETVYGEPGRLSDGQGLYQGAPVRRATFNPRHWRMVQALECFLREGCHP